MVDPVKIFFTFSMITMQHLVTVTHIMSIHIIIIITRRMY